LGSRDSPNRKVYRYQLNPPPPSNEHVAEDRVIDSESSEEDGSESEDEDEGDDENEEDVEEDGGDENGASDASRPVSPRRTPSPTGALGKDRIHAYSMLAPHRILRMQQLGLDVDLHKVKMVEKTRIDALEKISTGLEYLMAVGYCGFEKLNDLTGVSEHTSPRPGRLPRAARLRTAPPIRSSRE
jgi:hypothetical protein